MSPARPEHRGSPAPGEDAAAALVVRGGATPDEVAALVVVLTAAASGGEHPASGDRTSGWAAHSAVLRRPLGHGPGAWRAAVRP